MIFLYRRFACYSICNFKSIESQERGMNPFEFGRKYSESDKISVIVIFICRASHLTHSGPIWGIFDDLFPIQMATTWRFSYKLDSALPPGTEINDYHAFSSKYETPGRILFITETKNNSEENFTAVPTTQKSTVVLTTIYIPKFWYASAMESFLIFEIPINSRSFEPSNPNYHHASSFHTYRPTALHGTAWLLGNKSVAFANSGVL